MLVTRLNPSSQFKAHFSSHNSVASQIILPTTTTFQSEKASQFQKTGSDIQSSNDVLKGPIDQYAPILNAFGVPTGMFL